LSVGRLLFVWNFLKHAAKCARAHLTSKCSRPSHRPPQGQPTLLLRACTIYALGGEWREPAAEDKLCVPVLRQAHTRTCTYVCNPMRSPGEKIPRKAGCRRERTTKCLQMEESIIAHSWLTPANFPTACDYNGLDCFDPLVS
jgi:hypothetical protein